jgi:hypothetical protein
LKIQEYIASGVIDDLHLLRTQAQPIWEFFGKADVEGKPTVTYEEVEGFRSDQ